MNICKISVFQVNLPLHEGSYNWSDGKSVQVFDSTVVRIETDEGITGWGETYSIGPDMAVGPTVDYCFELIKGIDPRRIGAPSQPSAGFDGLKPEAHEKAALKSQLAELKALKSNTQQLKVFCASLQSGCEEVSRPRYAQSAASTAVRLVGATI